MNKGLLNKYCRKLGFEIHGSSYIQSIKKETFKEDPFSVQKEITGECPIIFDVGANRGDITSKYSELFSKARIFAFEPYADSLHILDSRFLINKKIEYFQTAIGEVNSRSTLFVNRNVDTNSLLRPVKMGLSSDQQVKMLPLSKLMFGQSMNFAEIGKLKRLIY